MNTSEHNEIDEPAYRRHTSSVHPSGGAKMHISAGPGVRSAKANRTGIINTIKYKEICATLCKCIAHHSGEAEYQAWPGVSSDTATKPSRLNTIENNKINKLVH
jgi:hypothetical protein